MIDLNLHNYSVDHKELNIIDNDLELFLQEIEIAVKIAPGEVWGIFDSINIYRYVFNQYVTLGQVKSEISAYISNNCSCSSLFPWTVDAEFLNLDGKNLLYITVTISTQDSMGLSEDFKASFLLGNEI